MHTSRSISFDTKRHADLIAWWDSQENASATIRGLIQAHLEAQPANGKPSNIDLADIRLIVETALEQKLAGLTLGIAPSSDQDQPENDVLSAFDDLLE